MSFKKPSADLPQLNIFIRKQPSATFRKTADVFAFPCSTAWGLLPRITSFETLRFREPDFIRKYGCPKIVIWQTPIAFLCFGVQKMLHCRSFSSNIDQNHCTVVHFQRSHENGCTIGLAILLGACFRELHLL